MTDKTIKYSFKLKLFLLELETNTDPALWKRWEEEYPEVLDWLWSKGWKSSEKPESDWQAMRVGFLKKVLVTRGFDRALDRACLFQSKIENLTPSALYNKFRRLTDKNGGEIEMPADIYENWITHFNQVVDEHGEAIADYSPTDLDSVSRKTETQAPKRYW